MTIDYTLKLSPKLSLYMLEKVRIHLVHFFYYYSIIPDRHLSAQQLSRHDLIWDNIFHITNI